MKFFYLLLIILLLAACTGKDAPADLIPKDKMETVLWQLMQSEEYANRQLARDSLKKAHIEKMKVYRQVFELNGISDEAFKKSYRYYMAHPDMAKVMFDSIAGRASRQRSEVYLHSADPLRPGHMGKP